MEKKFRKFTDEEMKLTQKVVDGKIAEMEHLKLMVEYNTFMLDKMLESNYLEKRRAFARQNNEFKTEIEQLTNEIEITQKQLEEGVEITGDEDETTKNEDESNESVSMVQ